MLIKMFYTQDGFRRAAAGQSDDDLYLALDENALAGDETDREIKVLGADLTCAQLLELMQRGAKCVQFD